MIKFLTVYRSFETKGHNNCLFERIELNAEVCATNLLRLSLQLISISQSHFPLIKLTKTSIEREYYG